MASESEIKDSSMELYEHLKEHKSYMFGSINMFNGIKIGFIEFEIIHGDHFIIRIYDCYLSKDYLYCERVGDFTTYEIFQGFIRHLNHLKFNKLKGKFQYKITPNFNSILSNAVFTYGECCVCLENTITKLKCNHNICYECKSQLKTNKCPMCRKGFCTCDECDDCNDTDSESESNDE